MKPAPFDYYAPTTVAEAVEKLAELGYSGKVLAGGQSLIPAMNFRMARPGALVDLGKVKELAYIKPQADGSVAIGTMTRDTAVEEDEFIRKNFPIVAETVGYIAHKQIRNRGSFGGAIAHADPAAQIPALAVLLDAKLKVLSTDGERWEDAVDFIIGPFMTTLEPQELLAEVVIPALPANCGCSYQQVSRQKGGYAQAAAIAKVVMDGDKVKDAQVVLFSVGETPIRTEQPNKVLAGQVPTAELIESVAEFVGANECDPGTDLHGTEEYRRNLVKVLVRRSLLDAIERAKK